MSIPTSPSSAGQTDPSKDTITVPWERVERFVGQFTHDIRNGLNALELQLTFLSEISTDPEAVSEIKQLRATLGEISRQLQTVKHKTGSVSAHTMEYPAGDFFEDLRERFERLHQSSAGRVHWQVAAAGAVLFIDPELGISALLELLDNGLYFGGEDVQLSLTVAPAADHGGTQVTLSHPLTQAPGVPPESWGREPLLTSKRNAYGLGMFRVRRTLEAQGAALESVFGSDNVLTTTITFPSPVAPGV